MYTTGTRHHQTQGAHGDGKHVSTPVRAISTKMWEQYTKKLPDDHRASRSDSAGLTALATIPKLRKARTISPEKARPEPGRYPHSLPRQGPQRPE